MARRKPRHLRAQKPPVATATLGVIQGEARPVLEEISPPPIPLDPHILAANDAVEVEAEPVASSEEVAESFRTAPLPDRDALFLHSVRAQEVEQVIPQLWPAYAGFIWKACTRSGEDLTPEWVFGELISHQMQLHLVLTGEGKIRGCAVTQIATQPSGRVTIMLTLASGVGVGKRLADLYPAFQRWCAEQRATSVRFIGRPGWVRAAAALGFQPIAVMAEAPIVPLDIQEARDASPLH